jgi:hypothetical protein
VSAYAAEQDVSCRERFAASRAVLGILASLHISNVAGVAAGPIRAHALTNPNKEDAAAIACEKPAIPACLAAKLHKRGWEGCYDRRNDVDTDRTGAKKAKLRGRGV